MSAGTEASPGTVRIDAGAIRDFTRRAGTSSGIADQDLDLFVDGVVGADLRGIDSHGVFRVPFYCAWTAQR